MNAKIILARVLLVAGILATGGPIVESLPLSWRTPVQVASVLIMVALGVSPPAHWSPDTPTAKTDPPQ